MAHVALYRKWRPLTFDDVVEQRHIVTTLKNSIKNNTISHAYLFCGTRGTGKTTLAKIFSRAINCLMSVDGNPCNQCAICKGILDGSVIDVVEIDAASNNGVDDVREIREAVMYVPAVTRYKVYIIDEVHMLSTGAFNALLKTLEEPPENVVFILATTEPQRIPSTILSRCQRFDFKRITLTGIASRLKTIAEDAGVHFDDNAINLIARLSEGGMRDAISLLDQCVSLGKSSITREDVAAISGLVASEAVNSLARAIAERDVHLALRCIKVAVDEGRDLLTLCTQLIDWFRNLMLIKTGGEALNLINLDEEDLAPVREAAEKISLEQAIAIIKELSETEARLKWSENQRILFEVTIVKLCSIYLVGTNTDVENKSHHSISLNDQSEILVRLESKVRELEKKLNLLKAGNESTSLKNEGAAAPQDTKAGQKKEEKTGSENTLRDKAEKEIKNLSQDFKGNKLRQWPEIIESIRTSGKMKVYAYLLDTECILKDKNTALIIVSREDGLKKTVLSRNESIEVIKEAFAKVLGKDMTIQIVDDKTVESISTNDENEDQVLEKLKLFASENNIDLRVED